MKGELAPTDGSGQAMDVRTCAGLIEAGFDVRLIGEAAEELSGEGAAGAAVMTPRSPRMSSAAG